MRKPYRSRRWTLDDWRKADQMEKIYMHLIEPDKWQLSPRDQDRLERLRQVWAVIMNEPSYRRRMEAIMTGFDIGTFQAKKDMRDARALFGEILNIDAELERHLAYDRYMLLYEQAEAAGDFDTARRAQDSALKLLEEIEKAKPKKAKQYVQITQIMATTDPKALEANNQTDEEIDYELIPQPEAERVLFRE